MKYYKGTLDTNYCGTLEHIIFATDSTTSAIEADLDSMAYDNALECGLSEDDDDLYEPLQWYFDYEEISEGEYNELRQDILPSEVGIPQN